MYRSWIETERGGTKKMTVETYELWDKPSSLTELMKAMQKPKKKGKIKRWKLKERELKNEY